MKKGTILATLVPETVWRETGNHGGKHLFTLLEKKGDAVLVLDHSTAKRMWVSVARFLPKRFKGYGFVPAKQKEAAHG